MLAGVTAPAIDLLSTGFRRADRRAVRFGRQRCRTGWRGSLARADISGTPALVFGRGELFQFGVVTASGLLVELLEEGNAPAATRAGAAAFGKLAGHLGTAEADEIDQLPPRHMEAIANLGIQVHH